MHPRRQGLGRNLPLVRLRVGVLFVAPVRKKHQLDALGILLARRRRRESLGELRRAGVRHVQLHHLHLPDHLQQRGAHLAGRVETPPLAEAGEQHRDHGLHREHVRVKLAGRHRGEHRCILGRFPASARIRESTIARVLLARVALLRSVVLGRGRGVRVQERGERGGVHLALVSRGGRGVVGGEDDERGGVLGREAGVREHRGDVVGVHFHEDGAAAETKGEGLVQRPGGVLGGDERGDGEVGVVRSRVGESLGGIDAPDRTIGEEGGGEVSDLLAGGGGVAILHALLGAGAAVGVDELVRGESEHHRHARQADALDDGHRGAVLAHVDVAEVDDTVEALGRLGEVRGHGRARRAPVRVEGDRPRLAAVLHHERLEVVIRQRANDAPVGVGVLRGDEAQRRARAHDREQRQRARAHRRSSHGGERPRMSRRSGFEGLRNAHAACADRSVTPACLGT